MVTSATSSSPSLPKLSAAGSAYLTGLAILANPRRIPASNSVVFDTQLYLGPTPQDMLIGSLRYFNSTNSIFEDGPDLYYINTSFARRGSIADVPVSGSRALSDYSFIGDIHSIIYLGRPGLRYLAPEESSHSNGNDLRAVTLDPCVRPFIFITGVAMERSKTEATFEINLEQYISCVKSEPSTKKGVSRLKPTTSFLCHIPDTAKFNSWGRKPMPGSKRYASICGIITGANRSGDGAEVEEFLINTECVTPCGPFVPLANPAALASPSSPGKSAALFSYGPPPQSSPQVRQRQNQGGN